MLQTVARHLGRRLPDVLRSGPIVVSSNHQLNRQMSSSPPASVWSLGKLNHVAIAVPDLPKATALYRDMLGASVSQPQVSLHFPAYPNSVDNYHLLHLRGSLYCILSIRMRVDGCKKQNPFDSNLILMGYREELVSIC